MADRIQIRRDTAANWASANPVLAVGEQGYETDTGKMKIGNGSSTWNTLSYFADTSSVDAATLDGLDSTDFATAAQGALADSAIQSADLATVATSGSYTDLSDQPTIPSITGLATETYVDTAVSNLVDTAPDALNTLNELAASLNDDADFAGTVTTSLSAKANTADLATVATSGAYSDLTGTPTIPSALTDLSITDGTAGQVLSADGDGTYTFIDAASGGGGSFEAVASGALANGDIVIVNADGTVSVGSTATTSLSSPSVGSTATFNSSSTYYLSGGFDSNSNKVVIAFSNFNEGPARAVVGTVSGTSISFGSPVQFDGDWFTQSSVTFDSNSNKIVISWSDRGNSNYGKAVVGTVSGTSISFGTPAVFKSSAVNYISSVFYSPSNKIVITYKTGDAGEAVVGTVSGTNISFGTPTEYSSSVHSAAAAFDSNSNKIVIGYTTAGDNIGSAIVGTVSGDSISFGTAGTHSTDRSVWLPSATFDSNSNKVVITYSDITVFDGGTGYFGAAVVGTVSDNSISFGSPVKFPIASGSSYNGSPSHVSSAVFDASSNVVAVSYRDSNNSNKGTVILGSVSGNSITFGSAEIVEISSSQNMIGIVDSNSGKIVVAYAIITGSRYANAVVVTPNSTLTNNLTAENYAGISDGVYADGATATIQTAGSVDDAQSGLTPGQAYYVQANGTLGLTPDTPSVFAGTAVSATSLLIGKEAPASTVAYADVTGTPDLSSYATETYVDTAVSNLVDTAPEALNTLNELAASLNDDADFAGTVTTSLAAKANSADLATVATSGAYSDLTGTPTIPSALTDLSITDGTAGQVLSADGDGTYTFIDAASGGGSGGTASFTSTTDLTAGDLVALSTSGTVSGITTQAQTLHSSPVQPSGAATKLYDNVSVAKISDTKYVLAYRNDSAYPVVYIATVEADNTVTTGVQYTFSTTTSSEGIDLFWNPIDEIGVVVSTTANQVKYQYFTVSGSAVSYQGISGSGTYANEYHAVYNYETNEIWVSWFGSNYSARYGGLHKAVWDGSTIAITNYSLGFTLRSEKNYNINALTTWGTDKVIGQWYDGYYSPARRWDQVFDTSTETWTTVATTDIYDDEGLQYLTYNPEDNIVVGMKSLDTAPGWVEYSESGGVITKGANFPVATDVDGNAITWGTNDIVDAKFINGKTYILSQSVYEQAFMYSLERIGQNDYNIELIFDEAVPGSYDMGRMARDSFADCGSGLVYVEGLSLRKLDFADLSVTNIGDFIGISTETVTANNPAVISIVGGINTNQSGLTPNLKYYATAVGALTTTLTDYPVGIATSATELLVTESYTSTQKKTDLQLATVATTGAYSDLTGTPTGLATETYVDTAVSNLVDTAPEALNTLNELAASLNDDADFAGTVTTSLAAKANTADLATVATSGAYSDLTGTPTIPADVSDLTDTTSLLGGGGGSFEAVASGSISDGAPTVLNSNGTVAAVAQEVTTSLLQTLSNPSAYGTSQDDYFGQSVAIDGNYAILSSVAEDDAGGLSSGKAYIFNVTTGTLVHTLNNPNAYGTSANDQFGRSTAISGNYAIVSAPQEDDANLGSGKAYIFNVTTGALVYTLNNPNAYGTSQDDNFGFSVAISGDYAIAGTYSEDDANLGSGKAYIFNVTTGALLHTLDNPNAYDTSANDFFGYSVAISGNYAIVGAYAEDDVGGDASGKAYIFNVTTGTLVHTLNNPNAYGTSANDQFGRSTAISGNYAIVSAYGEADAGGTSSGKAYIFDVTTGTLVHTLDNPNAYGTSQDDKFGWSVGISGDYAIVTTVDEDDAGGTGSGKAYIFNVASGTLVHTYDNPNPNGTSQDDKFGNSVAISDNYFIVSAVGEDDANLNSGKAYIYSVPVTTTNLTAENYAGIADAAYADAATATIQTAGSVDDAQSGLTPGQAYYVQVNGTLGLTPDTPRVFAGVAASATSLLIGKEGPAADLSSYASTSYVDTAVSNLVDTAPEALNTLNELAASLNDDADFAGTVTTSLSTKLGTDSVIDGGTV